MNQKIIKKRVCSFDKKYEKIAILLLLRSNIMKEWMDYIHFEENNEKIIVDVELTEDNHSWFISAVQKVLKNVIR